MSATTSFNCWEKVCLGDVVTLINGRAYKQPEMLDEGTPILRIQNLNGGNRWFFSDLNLPREKYCEKGDLLYAWSATFGPYLYQGPKAIFHYHIWNVIPSVAIDKRFAYYELLRVTNQIKAAAHGVAMPHITKAGMESWPLLLPPLAEQQRIADKLDTVLARVDAVNDRLARVTPLLKRFRQSVLAAATSGRLTADWRTSQYPGDEHGYQLKEISLPYAHNLTAPSSWQSMRFDEAIELIGGSQPPKAVFVDEEQPGYVRLIQIRDYKSDRHLTYIPRDLARRFCSATDVMIGRYGPPIFQILRGLEGAYNVALMKAVPRDGLFSNDYLYYMLQREDMLRYVEAGSDRTAGQDGVRKDHLAQYPVFVPSMREQTEIVRRVDLLFAFADRLEARLQAAQTASTRLTPALLAKAFRGELVPQDPNDEPAAELLKRLSENQTKTSAAGQRQNKRKLLPQASPR